MLKHDLLMASEFGNCVVIIEAVGLEISPTLMIDSEVARRMIGWVINQYVTSLGVGRFLIVLFKNIVNYIINPSTRLTD